MEWWVKSSQAPLQLGKYQYSFTTGKFAVFNHQGTCILLLIFITAEWGGEQLSWQGLLLRLKSSYHLIPIGIMNYTIFFKKKEKSWRVRDTAKVSFVHSD